MLAIERPLRKASLAGDIHTFLLRISVPVLGELGWSCELEINGLSGSRFNGTHTLYGSDGWQAMTLSMAFARLALEQELEQDAKILFSDTDEEFDLDFVYPNNGATA
ncbi:hypothetical protein LJR125_003143 [Pseudoxanthomonas sp. LjRoot125]|uniref:DUF6968 family protein n=1 Tax=Pseudoxanthomonas sp. LjRoot125 TaxID=3342258 RepID=UPI003E11FA82